MSGMTIPVTGGCLCGAVRYEADEPPHHVEYCHCRMCQKHSGSAFGVSAAFRADSFRITRGAPKFYKSSDISERGFCADCGSSLIDRYFDPDDPYVWVGVGTLYQGAMIKTHRDRVRLFPGRKEAAGDAFASVRLPDALRG